MNKGIVTTIPVLAILMVLVGCSTLSAQQLADSYEPPIAGSAEVNSTICVEVTPVDMMSARPVPGDRATCRS